MPLLEKPSIDTISDPIRHTVDTGTLVDGSYRDLFHNNPCPMWVYDAETRAFLDVNEAAVRQYGYSRQEFLEMTLEEIRPREEATRFLEKGPSSGELEYQGFWKHRKKDGTVLEVEVNTHKLTFAGRQAKMALLMDVTERRRNERSLEERTTYLNALIENSPLAILVHDPQGCVRMCNGAFERLFQYRQSEVLGLDIDQLLAPASHMAEANGLTEQSASGRMVQVSTQRKRKDGTLVDVEIRGVPLSVSGKITGVYALYEDITGRLALEEQVRQAQKMEAIGRLAGGIAHDFNNLLAIISGYGELVRDRLETNDPSCSKIDSILNASNRAASLTRQLLAFSRKQVLMPRVIALNSVVMEMEKMLDRLIGEDIEVISSLASDLGQIKADPDQIGQVIMNLALNARDAMPLGGRLIFETANVELEPGHHNPQYVPPGNYIKLTICDTGVGMDAHTLSHVFEPFFTTKEQGKGTGLGLATAYGIVKQSGGYVWCTSEPNQGTTFTLCLPRVDEPKKAKKRSVEVRELPGGAETVLVVEDAESLRELTQEFLELGGYNVITAGSATEALQASQENPSHIDLLLTDVIMPGKSGPELAESLLALRPEMKIVYMSGYTDDRISHHGVLSDGVVLIPKPFTREALARKVRQVLDGKPLYPASSMEMQGALTV